jgi:hypothetical protein
LKKLREATHTLMCLLNLNFFNVLKTQTYGFKKLREP